ncbi:PREDICTED: protein bicaudal C homolog 1-A-like [Priapulus caudatus]|uniref:Protein bicaudal C homolog 1-A-like n=1 Tax=Priapulus caudatus TaxID=37621 RepID=A0ABM1EAR6_PRICU|nr:PREDICTED: protein bicaudal C homolog 1-A-like [Priapulus caudatus]
MANDLCISPSLTVERWDKMRDMSQLSDDTELESNQDRDPDLVEERFRVDRRKLEQMLQAAAEGHGEAVEDFFRRIMDETTTQITWPSKLKIGAKSKKV